MLCAAGWPLSPSFLVLALLVEGRLQGKAGNVKLFGESHTLCEHLVLARCFVHAAAELLVALLYLAVFASQRLVFLVEAVYFFHIVAGEGRGECRFRCAVSIFRRRFCVSGFFSSCRNFSTCMRAASYLSLSSRLRGVVFDVLAGVLELCKFVVEVLILPFKLSLSHIELHEFDFGTGCVGCAASVQPRKQVRRPKERRQLLSQLLSTRVCVSIP